MKRKKLDPDKAAKALGASVRAKAGAGYDWPLGWMGLAGVVLDRLVSTGGRPSDPRWDTKRLVPFRRDTWKRLSKEAEAISSYGRKAGPAQLAAILIERESDSESARGRPGTRLLPR